MNPGRAFSCHLVLNDRIVDPVTEGVDVSLRLGNPGTGHFIAKRLGHVRRLLVASPAYLERQGTPGTPHDLIDHPFLRVSGLFNDGRLPLVSRDGEELIPLLPDFAVPGFELHTLYPAVRPVSPEVRVFLSVLAKFTDA